MSDLTKPVYLGDGLYVEFDGWQVILFASNGEERTNTVYLEPGVLDSFFRYCNDLKAAMQNRQPCVSAEPREMVIVPWRAGD